MLISTLLTEQQTAECAERGQRGSIQRPVMCVHSRHPNLILAGGGDVPHPRQRLIAALLDHLQVSHLRRTAHMHSLATVATLSAPASRHLGSLDMLCRCAVFGAAFTLHEKNLAKGVSQHVLHHNTEKVSMRSMGES